MAEGPYKLPRGWRWVRLGEVCIPTERRNPSKEPDVSFVYVDISAVDNKTGQIVSPKEMKGAKAPSRARKVIRANDIIFATTRPYLKNIALVPPELDGQICSTGFCVIRANPNLADPKYLFYLCRSDCVINQLNVNKMRGASYPAVTDNCIRSNNSPPSASRTTSHRDLSGPDPSPSDSAQASAGSDRSLPPPPGTGDIGQSLLG